MSNVTLKLIKSNAASLHSSEKNVKQKLSVLSRDILAYLVEQEDSQVINGLIHGFGDKGGLTAANKKLVIRFFRAHTKFKFDADTEKFGGLESKSEQSKITFRVNVKNFLADSTNDIWTWAKATKNEGSDKPETADFEKAFDRAAKKAIAEGHLTADALVAALLKNGATAKDLLDAVTAAASK